MGARWVAFTLALVGAFIHAAAEMMVEGPEVIQAGWSIATYPRLSGPGSFPELHV